MLWHHDCSSYATVYSRDNCNVLQTRTYELDQGSRSSKLTALSWDRVMDSATAARSPYSAKYSFLFQNPIFYFFLKDPVAS
jgi:hypothetical protein